VCYALFANKGHLSMSVFKIAHKDDKKFIAPKKATAQYARKIKKSGTFFKKGDPTKAYLLAYAQHLRFCFIFDVAINDFAAREEATTKIKSAEYRMKVAQNDYDFDVKTAQRESEKICVQYKTQYANVLKTMQT
jgi:hypothetical protein